MLKKLLLIILIPVLLTGCGKKTQNELTFASWGSITEVGILKQVIKNYESENPNIKINFMHIPQNYFQKIHLLFASNTPPDVIFINNLNLPMYEKYLTDLSEEINKDEFFEPAIKGLSYDNKILAAPRDISELVFYVNLDKTKLPNTDWKIEDLVKYRYKDSFTVSYENDIYSALPYLSYFGGGIFDKDFNLIINEEKSKKAIEFYKDLKNKYKIAPSKTQVGSSTLAQMFLDGKIVFYLSGRWMYPKISEKANFNWAVINFPYGESALLCDASGWAVTKGALNKSEALKFVKYLSGKRTSEYFAKTGLIVPARIDTIQLLNNKNHNEKVFFDIIERSKNTPVNKEYKRLTDKINSELDL